MSNVASVKNLKSDSSKKFLEGSLWKNILFFSLPLMASQLLQVLFNISDLIIVGKGAAGATVPVGAVGSNSTLLTLFTGLLIGLGAGVNVKVAQYAGSKRGEDVKKTVSTAFVLSAVAGVVLFAVCFFFARNMLELLKTKDELVDKAVIYLKIYSVGMPAAALFNYGNGVLSAVGDTKRPLIYLAVAGVLNVGLNLFFVLVVKLDVEGVALASAISQYLSAALVLFRMTKVRGEHKLDFKSFSFDGKKAREVLLLGIPAGIQNAIFAVANLFIQTAINSFPYKVATGNITAQNADSIIFNAMAAFYTACSTFIGQNYGAGKKDRVLKSYFISMFYAFVFGLVLGSAAYFKGDVFVSLFDKDPEVIAAGAEKLKVMGWFYCLGALMDATIAASRGIGKSLAPTAIVVMGSCVFRIIWIYTVFASFGTIPSLYLLYPVSWAITALAELGYFIFAFKKTGFLSDSGKKA